MCAPRANPPSAPLKRANLSFFLAGSLVIVDVALTHPTQSHTTIAAAKRADGGAATTYESVKTTKCAAMQPLNSKFVPFIVETYGALGRSAVAALKALIPLNAQRVGLTTTAASRIACGRITGAVVRGVAGIAALAQSFPEGR